MQSLTDRLIKNVNKAVLTQEEQYFIEWRKAETPEDREEIALKAKALKDLQFTLINTIRGTEDG